MIEGAEEAIARAFVDARRSGAALAEYPGAFPEALAQGYAIQRRAIALSGRSVSGWKVGRIAPELTEQHGINRFAGPIFADAMVAVAGDASPGMPVYADGFAAAEAEYLLRIGSVPASFDQPWTNAAVAEYVDQLRIGIEVAGSPFPGINDHGPAVTISDYGNNIGLVIGAPIDRDAPLLDWPVTLAIDGIVAGSGTAGAMLDGPFGAVRFLFELARDQGLTLAAGHWVSTGAVTGVHRVRPGAVIAASFGGSTVRCGIGAYAPE